MKTPHRHPRSHHHQDERDGPAGPRTDAGGDPGRGLRPMARPGHAGRL